MRNFFDFFKKSFLLFLIFTILLTFLKRTPVLAGTGWASWAGLFIAFANALVGFAIISWGLEKKDKQFYGAFFGGMLVRFVVIFLILFLLIKFFDFHEVVLAVSLLVFYFSFLILEIWSINKLAALRGNRV